MEDDNEDIIAPENTCNEDRRVTFFRAEAMGLQSDAEVIKRSGVAITFNYCFSIVLYLFLFASCPQAAVMSEPSE